MKIVASVLNADLGRLRETCAELEESGLDAIQWDVMDGHFVPDISMGAGVIAACRDATSLPFEVHLMVDNPDASIQSYIDAGCGCVIVHAEVVPHLHRSLSVIRGAGAQAGVALNPATPLQAVEQVMDLVDLLLVMTVNPGFGGQSYIRTIESKIRSARGLIEEQGHAVSLEVDGGISSSTIKGAAEAGADRFIVGSALFRNDGGPAAEVKELRDELETVTAGVK
ncbi:MAG: ribulose-phosphate 3-epimerase [Actinomycetota bacterium]